MRYNPWKPEKPKSKYRPYKKRDRPTLKTMFTKEPVINRLVKRKENGAERILNLGRVARGSGKNNC